MIESMKFCVLIFLHICIFCSWLARTDPRDVARVESKTVIVTQNQRDTVPTPLDGGVSQLGRWMSPEEFDKAMGSRFPGCMKGTRDKVFTFFFFNKHWL